VEVKRRSNITIAVRRIAKMPHYDGVIGTVKEPTVIAISGIGPIPASLGSARAVLRGVIYI
jgi:hypothetical protein